MYKAVNKTIKYDFDEEKVHLFSKINWLNK